MKKILCALTIIQFFHFSASGQRMLGIATGNFNSMNSLYLNPASIAGCDEKLVVSLFSLNLGVDNNLGTISSIGDISNTLKSNDSGTSTSSIFKFSNANKFSMMAPALEIRGPGILYRINSRHTIALTTRVRAFNEFNNFDRSLYNAVSNPSSVSQGDQNFTSQNFNWTAHVWSEIGLSYGAVIVDQDKFLIKGGFTARYLIGIGYMGMKGRNLDVQYRAGSDSIHATNSDIEFASNAQSLSSAIGNGGTSGNIFGGPSGGKGFGGDVGVSFLYRPEADKWGRQGYKFALSASMTDIGAITYNTSYNVNVTGNGYLSGTGIANNVKDYQDFRNYVISQGYNADTGVKSTKVYLPTAFIVSADYHAFRPIYINATFIGSVANPNNYGSQYYNQLTITPRFDSKLLSVGLPLTYNMLTNNMRLGVGIRFSGFFIGSDDMMALFSGNQYGFNFYMGGMIPIFRKPDYLANKDFSL